MKIGILTHHYVNNYGAFLQGWALREAIAELYPEAQVEIIDYVNIKHFVINVGGWFRFYKNKENLKIWLQKIQIPMTFSKARKEKMTLSKTCYTTKQVNNLGYDCIVVGSDEVWNFKDSKSNAPIKFGQGLECRNIIAYAPSVGQTELDDELPEYVINGIKEFKAISARDDLTFEIVKKVSGIGPTRVLDPTFLAQFPKANLKVKKPYILFYYCDKLSDEKKNQIISYAKKNNLAVYGAGETDKRYTDITVNLTPFEWVEMFRNAEFVFTGTFHGAVFSILNKRQFKVYLTNKSRIKKVGALLKELHISNRSMAEDFVFDLNQMKSEIDYEAVYKIIEDKRNQSREYLLKHI